MSASGRFVFLSPLWCVCACSCVRCTLGAWLSSGDDGAASERHTTTKNTPSYTHLLSFVRVAWVVFCVCVWHCASTADNIRACVTVWLTHTHTHNHPSIYLSSRPLYPTESRLQSTEKKNTLQTADKQHQIAQQRDIDRQTEPIPRTSGRYRGQTTRT